MERARILLVEDDPNLGLVLEESLENHGYEVVRCTDGACAHAVFVGGRFDLCLVDVMLPVKDGFALAREIRSVDKETPIVFLTAKSLKEDRIEGFRIGGDDYVIKPFSMEELLLRIRAVLRRTGAARDGGGTPERFAIGRYEFDHDRRTLALEGDERRLTDKEADLLLLLCLHMNGILDRDLALERVWGKPGYFTSRSMDVYVSKLRKYLAGDPRIELANVRGRGFKLAVRDEPRD